MMREFIPGLTYASRYCGNEFLYGGNSSANAGDDTYVISEPLFDTSKRNMPLRVMELMAMEAGLALLTLAALMYSFLKVILTGCFH